ncbi:MAG: hypothetical protein ACPL3B_04375 [Fervidobacterium sp.]
MCAKTVSSPKRISDVIPSSKPGEGKVDIRDLLGKEILITRFEEADGDYGTYFLVYFKTSSEGIEMYFTCGGQVVIKKLRKIEEANAFPVLATVVRQNRYYDLV